MKYENIDEATQYQEACRKVKQIADAIKHIRIKYYPNFAKISDADREVYDQLSMQIERIAEENGLDKLRTELIGDISDKYDGNITSENEGQGNTELQEKILKAYYGAIDVGKQALSEGKIKKARNCQKQADTYMEKLEKLGQEGEQNKLVEIAIHYKREKFAELVPAKDKSTIDWEDLMKSYYREEDVQARSEAKSQVEQVLLELTKEHEEKEISEMIIE